jgi:hypothetical protein
LLRHSCFVICHSGSNFDYFGVVAAGLWPAWQQPMPLARRPQAGGYI